MATFLVQGQRRDFKTSSWVSEPDVHVSSKQEICDAWRDEREAYVSGANRDGDMLYVGTSLSRTQVLCDDYRAIVELYYELKSMFPWSIFRPDHRP